MKDFDWNFSVGIMTHNVIAGLRLDLLEATIESACRAFPVGLITVLDNNSNDGTDELGPQLFDRWPIRFVKTRRGNGTPGDGRSELLDELLDAEGPETIVVMSDDDMAWKEGAAERLKRFWDAPERPEDLVLVGGYLEPDYAWNTPRGVVEAGGERVLVRDTTCAAAWTCLSFGRGPYADWAALRREPRAEMCPVRVFSPSFGYDVKYCHKLAAEGLRVGQLDLADHLGGAASTHGNQAHHDVRARPLDRVRWGV